MWGLKKNRVKASALGYAISFLLLVGLICSGVLFVASANKRLEVNYSIEEHLIFNNRFALNFGTSREEIGEFTLPHPTGDTSEVWVKNWGAFRVIEAKTRHGKRLIRRSALIGMQQSKRLATFYIPESKEMLTVCGDTKLEGDIIIGKRGLEVGAIEGANYTKEKLFFGSLTESETSLPIIRNEFKNISLETYFSYGKNLEWTNRDSSFLFSNKTTVISQIAPIVIENELKGNVIVHSFDSIYVRNTAKLEHIILIAPKIRFEKGFKGTLQAIAHELLVCEENVSLLYPSVLILNEQQIAQPGDVHGIFMSPDSKVLGGILMVTQKMDFRFPIKLNMNRALVAGFVFNQGSSQIQGKLIGSIYTSQIHLKTKTQEYKNHLLDATISSALLPKKFVYPNWLKSDEQLNPILLTCF